ncbi:hypothetical protein JYU34_010971 [Plutella xylostella]|uniref:Uncharacterized protein n=1 Tax=Plutella xylostella TaxID=51655 RepID=A0ABQ7QFQ6_PLUXY|nr:hypothetical protein JYU34_010971 [Plutella xylostella]
MRGCSLYVEVLQIVSVPEYESCAFEVETHRGYFAGQRLLQSEGGVARQRPSRGAELPPDPALVPRVAGLLGPHAPVRGHGQRLRGTYSLAGQVPGPTHCGAF